MIQVIYCNLIFLLDWIKYHNHLYIVTMYKSLADIEVSLENLIYYHFDKLRKKPAMSCFSSNLVFDFFRYDARSKSNISTWSEERPRGFGQKAQFVPRRPNAILFVEDVGPNDGGLFRCRVDYQTAQTKNYLINLTVIGKLTFIDTTSSHIYTDPPSKDIISHWI